MISWQIDPSTWEVPLAFLGIIALGLIIRELEGRFETYWDNHHHYG